MNGFDEIRRRRKEEKEEELRPARRRGEQPQPFPKPFFAAVVVVSAIVFH